MALSTNVNQSLATGAHIIFAWIEDLVAAGCSIYAYGDGGPLSGDRHSGGVGFTVNTLFDVDFAWVEVELQDGITIITFRRANTGVGTNNYWWIRVNEQGVGTDGTGQVPDSGLVVGDSQNWVGTSSMPLQLFDSDSGGPFRVHPVSDNASPYFSHLQVFRQGTTTPTTFLALWPLNVHADDPSPRAYMAGYRADGGVGNSDNLSNSNTSRAWYGKDTGSVRWDWAVFICMSTGGRKTMGTIAPSPYTGATDRTLPTQCVVRGASGYPDYWKGEDVDGYIRWSLVGRASGTTTSVSPSPGWDFITNGDLLFAWPTGVSVTL